MSGKTCLLFFWLLAEVMREVSGQERKKKKYE